jgi:hypothetical protein
MIEAVVLYATLNRTGQVLSTHLEKLLTKRLLVRAERIVPAPSDVVAPHVEL